MTLASVGDAQDTLQGNSFSEPVKSALRTAPVGTVVSVKFVNIAVPRQFRRNRPSQPTYYGRPCEAMGRPQRGEPLVATAEWIKIGSNPRVML